MASDDSTATQWRADLLRSYLERDVPMFAPRIPAETLRRLWTMLAHSTGGLFNASRLAENLSVSGPTVTRYVDLLVDLGLVRRLDLHALLGHPVVGASYESFAVESLIGAAVDAQPFHYRTARGDEVDLVLVQGGQPRVAIEVKRSSAPTLSAGFHRACDDLEVTERYLVHPSPGSSAYVSSGGVVIIGLGDLVERLRPAS